MILSICCARVVLLLLIVVGLGTSLYTFSFFADSYQARQTETSSLRIIVYAFTFTDTSAMYDPLTATGVSVPGKRSFYL
jgi:hypothetical protein